MFGLGIASASWVLWGCSVMTDVLIFVEIKFEHQFPNFVKGDVVLKVLKTAGSNL